MRKQRKIRKEDIGDPSNFVHVKHVGFGEKKKCSMLNLENQRSFDLGESNNDAGNSNNNPVELSGSCSAAVMMSGDNSNDCEDSDAPNLAVERRAKGSRSLIPRHHRSTTTCIFSGEGHSLQNHLNISSHRGSGSSSPQRRDTMLTPDVDKGTLRPTFGSLLNLNFLGKSSSSAKNNSGGSGNGMGKTKRLSLLNLTAANLFSSAPKGPPEEKSSKGAVKMTGFMRRRSLSNSGENDKPVSVDKQPERNWTLRKKREKENKSKGDEGSVTGETLRKLPPLPPLVLKEPTPSSSESSSTEVILRSNASRIPLAKLGRSKSTMADYTKRPKLKLKIIPPVQPPPPIPKPPRKINSPLKSSMLDVIPNPNLAASQENLPSPPPSPLPSPPKTPTSAPPMPPPPPTYEEEYLAENKVILRKMHFQMQSIEQQPRSRIIPLPSSPSVDSLDFSPQYLTPAGGSSPMPLGDAGGGAGSSAFPLLSPTIPQTTMPLFSGSGSSPRNPGTPPIWPLQPLWPVMPVQTEPTIPEVPSPSKEEMEIGENEYSPVASLVDSFLINPGKGAHGTDRRDSKGNDPGLERVCSSLISSFGTARIPTLIQILFNSMKTGHGVSKDDGGGSSDMINSSEKISSDHVERLQKEILHKSIELWKEVNCVEENSVENEISKIFNVMN